MGRQEPPLDQATWQEANNVIIHAYRNGQDPVEQLNRAGLLITPARRHQMQAAGLDVLLERLQGWTSVEILRRRVKDGTPGTPADMYIAVLGFIAEFVKVAKEDGL